MSNTFINYLLYGSIIVIVVALGFCLLRVILGPRFTDRIMAVNMIGSKVIAILAILSVLFSQEYLLDICLVYALISFLAVVVLSRIYLEFYSKKHEQIEESLEQEESKNE